MELAIRNEGKMTSLVFGGKKFCRSGLQLATRLKAKSKRSMSYPPCIMNFSSSVVVVIMHSHAVVVVKNREADDGRELVYI